jgi:hypothetical protein
MAILDVLESLGVLDISPWRLVVPTVVGIGIGLAVYYLSGETPASAAVAFVLWLVSLGIGLAWQFGRGRRR